MYFFQSFDLKLLLLLSMFLMSLLFCFLFFFVSCCCCRWLLLFCVCCCKKKKPNCNTKQKYCEKKNNPQKTSMQFWGTKNNQAQKQSKQKNTLNIFRCCFVFYFWNVLTALVFRVFAKNTTKHPFANLVFFLYSNFFLISFNCKKWKKTQMRCYS